MNNPEKRSNSLSNSGNIIFVLCTILINFAILNLLINSNFFWVLILKAKAINPVTIAVAIELPFFAIFIPLIFFSFSFFISSIPRPIISSPGAYVFGFDIKVFLSSIAGPLDECLYIEKISLLTEPMVKTEGRIPGNVIVP